MEDRLLAEIMADFIVIVSTEKCGRQIIIIKDFIYLIRWTKVSPNKVFKREDNDWLERYDST